jgi:hypothetical protein
MLKISRGASGIVVTRHSLRNNTILEENDMTFATVNSMKTIHEFLDIHCSDRQFTAALDLKNAFHLEFMARLRSYVQENYDWEKLVCEKERQICATSFVEQHRVQYWGTEENRRKYLMGKCLEGPADLCTFPERKRK